MTSIENLAEDPFQAVGITVQLQRMLAIPIIWTPNITTEDLDQQLYQSTRSHLAAKELIFGRISWSDYLAYIEELKIDSQSLLDLYDIERYLM